MPSPTHFTPRELRLVRSLALLATSYRADMERLITRLKADDDLLAELMSVCARPGSSNTDSGLEFVTDQNGVPAMWMLSGGELETTHHLPEPNDPS